MLQTDNLESLPLAWHFSKAVYSFFSSDLVVPTDKLESLPLA
jgi:hypothetical protein